MGVPFSIPVSWRSGSTLTPKWFGIHEDFVGVSLNATISAGTLQPVWAVVGASIDADLAGVTGFASGFVPPPGGHISILQNSTTNSGIHLNGTPFQTLPGKKLLFGVRMACEDFDGLTWYAGLSRETASAVALTNDMIGFIGDDGDGTIEIIARRDATSTLRSMDSGVASFTADRQFKNLHMEWDGRRMKYFVDGQLAGIIDDNNVPRDTLQTIGVWIDGTGEEVYLDEIYCWQER